MAGLCRREQRASEVLKDLCAREAIQPNQVILHSDNGGPMKGATMLATLQALGVMPSLSRPGVSNDNPYSESLFKTPSRLSARSVRYPVRGTHLGCRTGALVQPRTPPQCNPFVTPAQRHANLDQDILDRRTLLYEAARERHPLRWKGATRDWQRIHVVHLNPDRADCNAATLQPRSPELKAA
jgi:transposase InsO family protein